MPPYQLQVNRFGICHILLLPNAQNFVRSSESNLGFEILPVANIRFTNVEHGGLGLML